MGQSQNSKTMTILNYYLLQNQIQQYLTKTGWKDKKDEYKIKLGYLVHPDWVKQWKKIIEYDKLKFYLKEFKIKSTKYVDEQEILVKEFITKPTNSIDIKSININSSNKNLEFENIFISLETLENLMNKEAYNIEMKAQQIKYLFKQKMLILFFNSKKIIKIIYFYEKKNKIINLKFMFNNIIEFNKKLIFLRDANLNEIIKYLRTVKIFNSKLFNYYDTDLKKITFKILYEEEEKCPNDDRSKNFCESNNTPDLLNDKENKVSKEKEDEEEGNDAKCGMLKAKTIKVNEFNELVNEEKIFSISIITPELKNIPITCKHDMVFNDIENQLLEEYPDIRNPNVTFLSNGKNIDRTLTFERNNIKAGDKIMIIKNEGNNNNENINTQK